MKYLSDITKKYAPFVPEADMEKIISVVDDSAIGIAYRETPEAGTSMTLYGRYLDVIEEQFIEYALKNTDFANYRWRDRL